MGSVRHLKYLAFAFFVAVFVLGRGEVLKAAYFDCIGSQMAFIYWGQEVECSEGYKNNMCEAGCDYCFNTHCLQVVECEPGQYISALCTNSA